MTYYTNRELSQKLQVNLAKWKRWSREFLPPDPLGGLQSGYARQYTLKDAFKLYLAGHLVSDLKMTVPEVRTVLADLESWLDKNGYYAILPNGNSMETEGKPSECRIYFFPGKPEKGNGIGYGYRVKRIIEDGSGICREGEVLKQTYIENCINCGPEDFLAACSIRMICISRLRKCFLSRLGLRPV